MVNIINEFKIVKIDKDTLDKVNYDLSDKIILENSHYKSIFGKEFKNDLYRHNKRGIVKVTFHNNNETMTLYRLFSSGNNIGITKKNIGLSPDNYYILKAFYQDSLNGPVKISLSKTKHSIKFVWFHPVLIFRLGFRWTIITASAGIIVGIVSIILSFQF